MNTTSQNILPVAAGPHRILPGGLAVSRAFGDIEAKIPRFGGNHNVLIAKPEITTLKINRSVDFIVMGSDGIFDVMSNDEVTRSVWNTIESEDTTKLHELLRIASENLIKDAMLKKSFDNVTVIIVGFPALEQKINPTNFVQGSIETIQELNLSPNIDSPIKNEDFVTEKDNGTKISPQNDSVEARSFRGRGERFTPYKIGQSRSVLKTSSSKKELFSQKIKEVNKKELESLPKIVPRTNGIRPSKISAL